MFIYFFMMMLTATQTSTANNKKKADALLEEFKTLKGKTDLTNRISKLLSEEVNWRAYTLHADNPNQFLIDLFQELFEWDEEYSVEITWLIQPATGSTSYSCNSKGQFNNFLFCDMQPYSKPTLEEIREEDDIKEGNYVVGEHHRRGKITISNLRLKEEN